MGDDPRNQLRRRLGEHSAAADALDDEQTARFATALEDSLGRQSRALEEAAEDSLRHVPGFLRGTVRRIVFR
jgi:hypothetical protein